MTDYFDQFWMEAQNAFRQERTAMRAQSLAYSALVCLGRHTVTGLVTAAGRQFQDWSADYRLFEQDRMNTDELFAVARRHVVHSLGQDEPVVAIIDDTILKKKGRKVAGASWRRDPLGPPFQVNLIWGLRFIQVSLALPEQSAPFGERAIPIAVEHCPTPKKPKRTEPDEKWDEYKRLKKSMRITRKGSEQLHKLRRQLDRDQACNRTLIGAVDGGYTNRDVLRNLPERTTLIGRVRKDAKLFELPEPANTGRGRKRIYGKPAQTPEEIRQDDSIPWQTVTAWTAGECHQFKIKKVSPLRWRAAGKQDLQLVVIQPLRYRLTKKSRLLYRDPAYLICTDPNLPLSQVLQYYLWRWGIELNFREEKQLIGCGEAHVRTEKSIQQLPAFMIANYAFLLLAGHKLAAHDPDYQLPQPKWMLNKIKKRLSTNDLLAMFKNEIWGKNIDQANLKDFASSKEETQSRFYSLPTLKNAVLFARF